MGISRAWDLLTDKVMGWMKSFILLLPNLLAAVVVLVGFWLAAKLARNLLHRLLKRITHSEQVNRLLAQTVFMALMAAGLFVSLGILGLQKTVASLLAGAGIVGLALGLAFQDIATNFMAGIYLSIQRPFRVGHLIETRDFFGIVQKIRLRWTELRTQQGQLVLIPNKLVFENPITNFSATGLRRIDLKAGVSYADDLEAVRRVAIRSIEQVSTRKPDTEVELFFEEFADSSIDFVVRFWIDFTSKPADYLRARSEAIERLKRAFDENGITIPFPIRTLDLGARGEKLSEILEEAAPTNVRGRALRRTS